MRHLAIGALILTLAFPARADSMWKLQIFSDAALTESSINDDAPRIVTLYVVESGSFTGATGSRFSTEPNAGFTGVWLGDDSQFATFGSSPTDVGIGYGACIPPPILVLTMTYELFGTSAPCSGLRIAPPDGSIWVVAPDVDCSFMEGIITDLGTLQVNCPTATQPTTWGRVKALYRS